MGVGQSHEQHREPGRGDYPAGNDLCMMPLDMFSMRDAVKVAWVNLTQATFVVHKSRDVCCHIIFFQKILHKDRHCPPDML